MMRVWKRYYAIKIERKMKDPAVKIQPGPDDDKNSKHLKDVPSN